MDRLHGPRTKLGRAKLHIDELKQLVGGFLATNPYEIVEKVDPETSKNRAHVRIHDEPDVSWSLIIGDALHNLRSSLDLLYCQLVLANGTKMTESDTFPIRDTKLLFDKNAAPAIGKRTGREALEIFTNGIKPYKGGNNALWCLHKLDIIDKHRLLLVVASANPLVIFSIEDETGKEIASHSLAIRAPWPLKDGDEIPAPTQVGHRKIGDAPKLQLHRKAAFAVTVYEPSVIEIPEPLDVSLSNMTGAVARTIDLFAPLFETKQ